VAVFPDDVSRLGALFEGERLSEKSHVITGVGVLSDEVGERLRVVGLKGDEGSGGGGQAIELLEQVVDLRFAFAHLVEVLSGDAGTTLTESLDKLRVVEGEHDVGDLGTGVLESLSLLFSVKLDSGPFVVLNPFGEFLLKFSNEGLLESVGGSNTVFFGTIRGLIDISLPVLVSVLLDGELTGEITGGDSGAIPLDLLDFATLVHVSDRHREKEGNNASGGN